MGSIYRIKEQINDFTTNEKKIANYILDFKDVVIGSSVQDVAASIGVSPAAIVRFSKKAGFKGFTNMKMSLAQDHQSSIYAENNFIIDGSESFELLADKARLSSLNTIDITYKLLNLEVFKEASEKVNNARRIYLVGIGGSGIVADDLYQKLIRVDREVNYSWDNNLSISALTHCNPEDVVLCFSYSGKTREIVNLTRIAKEKGATTIAITQIGTSPLSKLADYVINIPKEESEIRLGAISSRTSMFIISDLMYFNLVNSNFDATYAKLVESRQLHTEKNT
ncbi:MAG TPA: MurR/RpiR family transcriptional regulator [Erysipelothrix sp.]|nr:MurR/RpiR family transcriptional regulator [Erysipelothrix sp.]